MIIIAIKLQIVNVLREICNLFCWEEDGGEDCPEHFFEKKG